MPVSRPCLLHRWAKKLSQRVLWYCEGSQDLDHFWHSWKKEKLTFPKINGFPWVLWRYSQYVPYFFPIFPIMFSTLLLNTESYVVNYVQIQQFLSPSLHGSESSQVQVHSLKKLTKSSQPQKKKKKSQVQVKYKSQPLFRIFKSSPRQVYFRWKLDSSPNQVQVWTWTCTSLYVVLSAPPPWCKSYWAI